MSIWDALVLGLLQGLTEFLPVSSSGHLALWRLLRGGAAEGAELSQAYDIVLHVATLLAVVIAFRGALWRILKEDRQLIAPLLLSTSLLGLALVPVGDGRVKDLVGEAREMPLALAAGFAWTALLLGLMTWLDRRRGAGADSVAGGERVGWGAALVIGALQLLAIFPGISRSGSTIAGARLARVPRGLAFEYAFLLSIPAILGAVVVEREGIAELSQAQPVPLIVGFLAALASGVGAIALVRWLLTRDGFWVFIPYVLICAGLTLWAG